MAPADQVVELVEEHRLPGFLVERRRPLALLGPRDRAELLRGDQRRLGATVQLLQRDARGVAAGEDRVQIAVQLGQLAQARLREVVGGVRDDQLDGILAVVVAPGELREMVLGRAQVESAEDEVPAVGRVGLRELEELLNRLRETGEGGLRRAERPVREGQPLRVDARPVDADPAERGRPVGIDAALEHVVVEPRLLHDLGHLRVVSERVQHPADRAARAEDVVQVLAPVQELADERLAGRHVRVGHHVHAAGDLEPARGDVRTKPRQRLGKQLGEALEVGTLVERVAVVGIGVEQVEHVEDVVRPDLQGALAADEDLGIEVRVCHEEEAESAHVSPLRAAPTVAIAGLPR